MFFQEKPQNYKRDEAEGLAPKNEDQTPDFDDQTPDIDDQTPEDNDQIPEQSDGQTSEESGGQTPENDDKKLYPIKISTNLLRQFSSFKKH